MTQRLNTESMRTCPCVSEHKGEAVKGLADSELVTVPGCRASIKARWLWWALSVAFPTARLPLIRVSCLQNRAPSPKHTDAMSATSGSSGSSGREKAGTKVGSWLGGTKYESRRFGESYVKREDVFEMFPVGRKKHLLRCLGFGKKITTGFRQILKVQC